MDKCLSLFLSPEPHFTPVYTQNAVIPLMVLIVKCLGFLHISLPDTILVHNSEVLSWCQSGITVQSFESWQPKNPSLHAPHPQHQEAESQAWEAPAYQMLFKEESGQASIHTFLQAQV